MDRPHLTVVTVGAYAVNCVIVRVSPGTCAIVDPGQDADRILSACAEAGLVPEAILLTHAHFDHIGAIPALLRAYPKLPVYVHPKDAVMFGHPLNVCPPAYEAVPRPPDVRDIATYGRCDVLPTPGHTPGSVCLRFGEALLSGDTLFRGSCGRTDFPGGDMAAMSASLARLAKLPPALRVIPGHGAETTIGDEVAYNPFMP